MKNLHVLPTDKPSRLSIIDSQLIYSKEYFINPQHIYITSDAEVKEGDYVYHNSGYVSIVLGFNLDAIKLTDAQRWSKDCKKIILTTDQDLIADGVQEIDDTFLEWFIENPSCENIEIKEEDYSQKCRECGETVKRGYICNRGCFMKSSNFIPTDKNIKYKIIIPKKEPNKTHYLDELPNMGKKVLAKMWKSAMPILESKQETLEEVAERLQKDKYGIFISKDADVKGQLVIDTAIAAFLSGMTEGAKWQAERMYSEEEVKLAYNEGQVSIISANYIRTEEWFEQFKKK